MTTTTIYLGPNFEMEVYRSDYSGWVVCLPHQCDSWSITPEYGHSTRQEAIAALERFMSEAQEALAVLKDAEDA